MKILKLRLNNINSLKGENEIDFDTDFSNRLFLITGDTGAGKSTILDAICCALYNKTPRLSDPRGLLSHHTTKAEIELEYEIKGQRYRNHWSIRRAYEKVDGDLQKAKMEISKYDYKKNEFDILETRISRVPKIVQSKIGLDFNQFQKSIMLAQGNFDAFLKAKPDQRADLLEKMTGTQHYAQIGKKVFEVHKDRSLKIVALEDRLSEIKLLGDDELKEIDDTILELNSSNRVISKRQKDIQSILFLIEKRDGLEGDIEKYKSKIEESKEEIEVLGIDEKALLLKVEDDTRIKSKFLVDYEREIEIIKKVLKLDIQLAGDIEDRSELLESLEELKKGLKKTKLQKEKKNKKIEELDLENRDSLKYIDEHTVDKSLLDEFSDISNSIDKFTEIDKKIKKEQKKRESIKLEVTQTELNEFKSELKYIKAKTYVLKYEEDRKELKPNEPCGLCGSLEHPYLKENIDGKYDELFKREILLEKSIQKLDNKLIKDKTILEHTEQNLKNLQNELDEIEASIQLSIESYGYSADNLVTVKKELEDRYVLYKKYKKESENYEKKSVKLKNELELFSQKIESNQEQSRQEQKKLEVKEKAIKTLQDSRIELYGIKDGEVEEKKLNKEKKTLSSTLEKSQKKLNQNRSKLKSKVDSIDEFKKLLDEKSDILKEIKIDNSIDRENLTREEEELKKELSSSNNELGQLTQRKKQHSENLQSSKKLRDEKLDMQKEIKPYEILKILIGCSSGKKFKKIAQSLTLNHLLSLANTHLEMLNSRYILIKTDKEELELDIVDTYMGNEKRSVDSLSGGESFLVSLALALGLSDMVSSKISIDSLFLDEGFGTLDSHTLNDALVTLTKLQNSGKMIGIISHVEILKEQITLQIEIKKGRAGVSSLNVVKN